jgi:hypothetical protein
MGNVQCIVDAWLEHGSTEDLPCAAKAFARLCSKTKCCAAKHNDKAHARVHVLSSSSPHQGYEVVGGCEVDGQGEGGDVDDEPACIQVLSPTQSCFQACREAVISSNLDASETPEGRAL